MSSYVMGSYQQMWDDIKKYLVSPMQVDVWIQFISPARGHTIRFGTGTYLDVDLLEALRNWRVDLLRPLAPEGVKILSPEEAIQMFMDHGLIVDQRQPNFD